jgi:hypothetical protein
VVPDSTAFYDDGRIVCDEDGVRVRWYYPWGDKSIPYRTIRSVTKRPLTRWWGKWRLWGSGDLVHWYNLDRTRPNKDTALALDTGGRVRPTITPDDPDSVVRILAERAAA